MLFAIYTYKWTLFKPRWTSEYAVPALILVFLWCCSCTKKATAALQQKRKPAALSYLRSRKLLEDTLNKRLGSLTTLESTFMTVEAAAGDIEVLALFFFLPQ